MKVPDFVKEAIIIAYDEEKLTIPKLMERFNLSRYVVKSVLTEAGVEVRSRRRIVDEETKQEIISAYASGLSARQLEGIYGVNRATIATWVRDIKREKPQVELDDQTREQIYRYHSQGYGVGIIAKTLGLGRGVVRKVIDGEL